jgi:hypothetical protein
VLHRVFCHFNIATVWSIASLMFTVALQLVDMEGCPMMNKMERCVLSGYVAIFSFVDTPLSVHVHIKLYTNLRSLACIFLGLGLHYSSIIIVYHVFPVCLISVLKK